MKKLLILPFLLALLFVGCEKDTTNLDEQNLIIDNNRGLKVDICHYDAEYGTWSAINVSENALPAHLNHGDVQLVDNDGDGWVEALNECVPGGDCNDDDATVNPGAEEVCGDGIDNNCNGEVDEDCGVTCPCITIEELRSINWCDRGVQFVQFPSGDVEPDGSLSPAYLVLQYYGNPATPPFNQVVVSGPSSFPTEIDGIAVIRGNDPGNVFLNTCFITFDETQACFDLVYDFAVNELGLSPTGCASNSCIPTSCSN